MNAVIFALVYVLNGQGNVVAVANMATPSADRASCTAFAQHLAASTIPAGYRAVVSCGPLENTLDAVELSAVIYECDRTVDTNNTVACSGRVRL